MNFSLLLLISLATIANCADITTWEQFKQVFGKNYESVAEELIRKANFEKSLKFILENKKNAHGIELGINENADKTIEELVMSAHTSQELIDRFNSDNFDEPELEYEELPAHFDWREQIDFNPIVNQGSCGSCWAFAVTASVEAALAIHKKFHVVLSKQELVDCSLGYGNRGCEMGFPNETFTYIEEKGIHESRLYPYNGRSNEACYQQNITAQAGSERFFIKGHGSFPFQAATDEQIMSIIRQYGPAVILVWASEPHFQHYKGGIIQNLLLNFPITNHVIPVIGWGSENGTDYWIIRNSWGTNWGEKGYGRIERHHGVLGFNNWVTYPIL